MKRAYRSINKGLTEAIDHVHSKPVKAVIHQLKPVDVKRIRKSVGMTQSEFAAAFEISVATFRHWERGDRLPVDPLGVVKRGRSKTQSSSQSVD